MSKNQQPTGNADRIARREEALRSLMEQRIVYLDGAMGTMIQKHTLEEEDFRGERFKDHKKDLRGNNDLLTITKPEIIEDIHQKFLDAGSDIIETNTFSGTTIAQADYGLEELVPELNIESARLARAAADKAMQDKPDRECFVAGALGPTNRTASISPDVNRPEFRNVTFDELVKAYRQQAEALIEGGVDILLVETIFDTLNAKAALFGIEELYDELGYRLPIMISVTITDNSGRTLSGQTTEAFWNSISHTRPFCVGVNCALGAEAMKPYVQTLSNIADCYVHCYPNAGLPNPLSETGYDETPDMTSEALKSFTDDGLINILGGCCGTTPEHIAAIVKKTKDTVPRKIPESKPALRLSGLEHMTLSA